MLKLISTLFDRIIFTLSFILGVQAPEFMQQYIQRLSGHLDEAKFQLQQFQSIADLQFNGDLVLLIERYKINSDNAIVQTGEIISSMVKRVDDFELQLSQLQHADYASQLYHFVQQIDLPMAKATLTDFQLAVPLEVGALSTGVIFAFTIVLMQASVFGLFKISINKLRGKSSRKVIYPSALKVKKDQVTAIKIESVTDNKVNTNIKVGPIAEPKTEPVPD